MIEVDGSLMEGGGQLLRMATAYSAILGEPIHVTRIREKRGQSGLKPQHLTTLRAVAALCGAEVKGLVAGSRDVEFTPGRVRGGSYEFDIGTAGSVSLLLQCVAPVAAYADTQVKLRLVGGTAVRWSPTTPIVENVVWAALRSMGFQGRLKAIREGYHPRGGGVVETEIEPIPGFGPLNGERSAINTVRGLSTCGRLPRTVAERQAKAAERLLRDAGIRTEIQVKIPDPGDDSLSPGSAISLWGVGEGFVGSDSLGERGKPAERVGDEAAGRIIRELLARAYVDLHTADNLILPCSLASGTSVFTTSAITLHTLTAAELARRIAGVKVEVDGHEGKPGRVTIEGRGIRNTSPL